MMFWLVTAVVVVVLFALAWWSSGRSGPLGHRLRKQGRIDSEQEAMHQVEPHRMGPPMFPGGGGL